MREPSSAQLHSFAVGSALTGVGTSAAMEAVYGIQNHRTNRAFQATLDGLADAGIPDTLPRDKNRFFVQLGKKTGYLKKDWHLTHLKEARFVVHSAALTALTVAGIAELMSQNAEVVAPAESISDRNVKAGGASVGSGGNGQALESAAASLSK